MLTTKSRTEVQAGADLLDEIGPPGWPFLVNLDDLDIGSSDYCTLGHVYGNYGNGLRRLGLEDGFDHGFEATAAVSYRRLTALWRTEILRRRRRALKLTLAA